MRMFKDHTAAELYEMLAPHGVTERLARRLQAAIVQRGLLEIPTNMPEVSPALLERVRRHAPIPRLTLLEKRVSPRDGFAKYLFRGPDGVEPFETVRIPLLHRADKPKYIVCVSSQVGCAAGLRLLRDGSHGFPAQPGDVGDRRSGPSSARRLGPSGARRRLHGYG